MFYSKDNPKFSKTIHYYKKIQNNNNCKELYYLYIKKCSNKKNIMCKTIFNQINEYYKCKK